MKNLSKFASVALIAGIALTGCSASDNTKNETSASQEKYNEAEVKTAVKESIIEFHRVSSEKSKTVMDSLDGVSKKMGEIMTLEELEVMSSDPLAGVEALEPDTQKKLSELYREADPVADYYSYEGLSDAEKSVVSLMSLMKTSILSDANTYEEAKAITDGDITVKDANNAVVSLPDATQADSEARADTHMVKVNDDWKIDGSKTVELYMNAAGSVNG